MRRSGSVLEVFLVFLRLGSTSFGGPVAHLGYYRAELIARRRWMDEAEFADIVALCQFMPGPASSQTGMAIGLLRAGPWGLFAAWVGFTLPSALLMIAFAYGVSALGDVSSAAWLKGLKLVAVAVVAQAVWGMANTLAPDRPRATLAVVAALMALAIPSSFGQIGAIILGGVVGVLILPRPATGGAVTAPSIPAQPASALAAEAQAVGIHRGLALVLLAAYPVLLVVLPSVVLATGNQAMGMFEAFYHAGALVFGGGHVMLPLLQAAVVPPGWVSNDDFLAGYGAAQALPGPLSTFASYLGTIQTPHPNGWLGGLIATVAIFFPSFLLVAGLMPFWSALRHRANVQATLRGVNAAVVGVLLAALYNPVWTASVHSPGGFGIAIAAFLALTLWAVPPWLVVAGGAGVAWALGAAGVSL